MVLVSSLGMEVEDGLPMVGVENGFLVGADRCISACDRDEDGGMVGRSVLRVLFLGFWVGECLVGVPSGLEL